MFQTITYKKYKTPDYCLLLVNLDIN